MKFVIQNKAKDDIKQIYRYSYEHFGERKADQYYAGLTERIEKIASDFVASTDFSHVKTGLRRTLYESHSIYFIPHDDHIVILRVLGQRQDTARHIQ